MRTQADYETEATVAVLESTEKTDAAIDDLRRLGIPVDAIKRTHAAPAIYQGLDTSLGEEVDGLVRGAVVGLLVGLAPGLIVAVWATSPSEPEFAALATAGAAMGAVVGSLFGAAAGAHYDDDGAEMVDLTAAQTAELISVQTHSHRATIHVRRALRRAGALALLDPNILPEAAPDGRG
jgi:hypothetical protein